MFLERKLIKLLNQPTYIPLMLDQIAQELNLTPKQTTKLKELIDKLLGKGKIARIKKDCYALAQDADLISGILKFRTNGSAILIPDHPPGTPEPEPLTIPAEYTHVGLHKDHVMARLLQERQKPKYYRGKRIPMPGTDDYAEVKDILQRGYPTMSGTLTKSRKCYFVIPDDPRIVYDIIVPTVPKFAKPNEKVLVKLFDWTDPHESPQGEIIQSLGLTHTPKAEYKALLHKYDLSPEFPREIVKEVAKIRAEVADKEIKGRLDCRDRFTLTIDPDDAKDFDDALSLEKLPGGACRIGIHIADVSAYVTSESHLDKEAQKRGNSTYLVGSVVPMLPHALSNGICSLVEGQNRLTKTVFLTFSEHGKITDVDFANTVICSNKRLTYHQAYAFLKKDNIQEIRKTPMPPAHQRGSTGRSLEEIPDGELKEIKSTIRQLWTISEKLRKERMDNGSLDLNMPEVKIFVDKEGKAERIEKTAYDESHQLIEEFMLAANGAVAKAFHDFNFPFISRVHDKPSADKLNELRDTLMTFNLVVGDLTKRKSVTHLLQKIKTHPQGYTLKIHFLRSLKQACYRAQNDGHYGLNITHYAHFTSPIRRYADLIIHRIFDHYLVKRKLASSANSINRVYKKSELQSLVQHLSIAEQNSTEAERESVKIKLLEFFDQESERKNKTAFDAIITEVRNHGIFIELSDSQAFGFIHASNLRDDLYKLNDDKTAFVGRRRGRAFRIGQIVQVNVEKVDRFKRQIDFKLAEFKASAPNSSQNQRSNDFQKSRSKK